MFHLHGEAVAVVRLAVCALPPEGPVEKMFANLFVEPVIDLRVPLHRTILPGCGDFLFAPLLDQRIASLFRTPPPRLERTAFRPLPDRPHSLLSLRTSPAF